MSSHEDIGSIYKQLLTHGSPFVHGGPWEGLSALGDIRYAPQDSTAAATELQQQFLQHQLLEAGVFVMDEPPDIQLDPVLCDPNAILIALRKTPEDDPFDLLTERGMVSGCNLPVCASLGDARARQLIAATKENMLLVTPSMIDVAVLLSLGIPATLATGLGQLGGVYLDQVRKRFDLYPPRPPQRGIINQSEEERRKKNRPPDLVLVGCSLAEMSREGPSKLATIVSHLTKVEQYLEVPLDRFYQWAPTEKEIRAIAFGMKHVGLTEARATILKSIETSTEQLIKPAEPSDGLPKDLATAIRELVQRLKRSTTGQDGEWGSMFHEHDRQKDREWQQKAWENIQRLVSETCVDAMFEAAQTADDPIERNLWMMAGTIGQWLHSQGTQMALKAIRDGSLKGFGKLTAIPQAEFRQWTEMIDRELKTLKEIQRCKEKQNPFQKRKKPHS